MRARRKRKRNHGYTTGNNCHLVHSGREYFDQLLHIIGQATNSLHLQVYIFDGDETGQEITGALIAAAKRNVQVWVMADGYASGSLPKLLVQQLLDAGVHFRFFDPLLKSHSFYFGRRLHHKVVVADAFYAMVGGINISNRYNDMPDQTTWLDFALYAEGTIAKELCMMCSETWKGFSTDVAIPPCQPQAAPLYNDPQAGCTIRMRRNDWVRKKSQISHSYLEMFSQAKSHITILSSYFLPGSIFRRRLKRAARKGIRIKIIIAGLSDVKLSKNAERFLYNWLIRNNIEIYEYQKSVLHGKLAVCDNEWVTIGSYNVNDISAFASIELNLDVRNNNFATQLETSLDTIIARDCTRVTKENLSATTNIFTQFGRWASYKIFRLIFYLFTFYFRQQKA